MYRLVDCGTWGDSWFEQLEPSGKLFFLYLLTNPRSTSCGAFEITVRQMAFDTGLDRADIERWLTEWRPRVYWWPEHSFIWLKNFYRRQGHHSSKNAINARRIVAGLPVEVQREIAKVYPDLVPDSDALSMPVAWGMDALGIEANSEERLVSSEEGRARREESEKGTSRAGPNGHGFAPLAADAAERDFSPRNETMEPELDGRERNRAPERNPAPEQPRTSPRHASDKPRTRSSGEGSRLLKPPAAEGDGETPPAHWPECRAERCRALWALLLSRGSLPLTKLPAFDPSHVALWEEHIGDALDAENDPDGTLWARFCDVAQRNRHAYMSLDGFLRSGKFGLDQALGNRVARQPAGRSA
jgi:hypothetical protein